MMKTANQAKYDEAIKALLAAVRKNMKSFPLEGKEALGGRLPLFGEIPPVDGAGI